MAIPRGLRALAVALAATAAIVLGAAGCRSEEQEDCQARCEETGAGLGTCQQICDSDCAESEIRFGLSRVACERVQQGEAQGPGS